MSRVALMGELAASLAHELNQPLTGIVTNAQVGQQSLDRERWNAAEFREILQDIADDGKRAGEIIRSMRNMVKKGQVTWELLDLNDVVTKAIRLANPDAMARGCQLSVSLEANLPKIRGVRIQLKQVLLNLIVNAFDAMHEVAPSQRVVVLSTGRDGEAGVRVALVCLPSGKRFLISSSRRSATASAWDWLFRDLLSRPTAGGSPQRTSRTEVHSSILPCRQASTSCM